MSLVWGDAAFGNRQVPRCEAGKGWQLCHRADASKCVVTVFKYNIKVFLLKKYCCITWNLTAREMD